MEYIAVIERATDGTFSAYVPDLPGCVTSGETLEETQQLIEEAVSIHLESLRQHGEIVPTPAAAVHVVPAA